MAGRLIIIEGPDGSGTTTHARILAQDLGPNVILTAEPSDGPIGRQIRDILKGGDAIPPDALQLLFTADRAWHVVNQIAPALLAGKTVVGDRYVASTLAYGEALGLDRAWLERANEPFPKPSVQIFLLPPLEVCWQRMGSREGRDSLETRELQQNVHKAYHDIAKREKIPVIDSAGSIEEVAEEIRKRL